MRKYTMVFLAALLLNLWFAGAPESAEEYDPLTSPVTAAQKSLVDRGNDFGFDLFRRIADGSDPDSNVLISPLSVSYALAMAYNGAAGETKWQIARALRLPDMPDNVMNDSYRGLMDYFPGRDISISMDIANSAWYLPGVSVRREFIDAMKQTFNATVRELNFSDPAGVDTINAWVADRTHDRIPQIIRPPLDKAIVMILLNAMYFHAPWTRAFDSDRTEPADFHLPGASVTSCAMMHRLDTVQYTSGESYHAMDLPYGNGAFSMILILPRDRVSLDEIIERLSANLWNEVTSGFSVNEVDLRIPRFAFSDDHGLNAVLKAMGMTVPFTSQADFSMMITGGGVWIDSVIHKTFVKVDERGTEAAAATAVMLRKGLNRLSIAFDRPFLFAIRERESGALLFIGKVVNPVFDDETG